MLLKKVTKVEVNVVDDEFLRVGDFFNACVHAHRGKFKMPRDRMKEDLVAVVIYVQLEFVLRESIEKIVDP